MKNKLLKHVVAVALLLIGNAVAAQEIAVESFTADETDQTARVASPRKDQNGKVCAIVKIETVLLLQDFNFDAGSSGIAHTEQKAGEIWVYLSPGTLRLTIQHTHLGVIRNYQFGEALKEATVYILKLKSGSVKTVIEDNVALQYIEIVCAEEGATVRIDDTEPEPFVEGKFQKLLSYGKHKYTVEAPGYHPESGMAEITAQKSEPVKIALKPKFGKLTVGTQPEGGADIYIDDEKRGQSPLTVDRLGSGQHKIRAVKPQFLPVSQDITMTDGANIPLTLTMQPNFAVITLTASDGGDIYLNDERKAAGQWSGRLTSGQYKVEVRKPSHRSSVTSVTARAGENQTVELTAPTPIYGSLNVKSNISADIFIDGKQEQSTTPAIVKNVLTGNRNVELKAAGYKPYRQTVEVTEGKIFDLNVELQEEEKTGSLSVTANVSASVYIDEKSAGITPVTAHNLSLRKKTVYFSAAGYKPLTKTVTIMPGQNEIYGELEKKKTISSATFINYRISPPTSYFGFSVGVCKRFGGYIQYRTDLLRQTGKDFLAEKNLIEPDEDFHGGERKYFRSSFTTGGMLRLFSFMYAYGGLGYGKYGAVYKVDDDFYSAGLVKGLEMEYGAIFKIGKVISLSAGYTTIAGSDFGELHFGIGLVFR